ncbi:MAG: uracil-DNA glycosylase, partial [Bacteroidota bacterium]
TESIEELNSKICNCQNCALGKTRTKFVFGVGYPNANAMLIGEAPGRDEDLQGEPFVGRAGKLLNDILKAVNFKREEVYIANILKCRPPNNRDPLPLEMETCIPYLHKQIDLIQPKVILCLGRVAANGLLNKKLSLGQLRESTFEFNGIKVMATYHPAALLRNPNWKRGCWEDVQRFRKIYDDLHTRFAEASARRAGRQD